MLTNIEILNLGTQSLIGGVSPTYVAIRLHPPWYHSLCHIEEVQLMARGLTYIYICISLAVYSAALS
ncbi:hypothetical protein V8C34DRAFT_276339 [Trichoderma compactum]